MPEQTGYNGLRQTTVSAKRCPSCGKVVGLQATECEECGHRFRTRFQEPTDRTEAFDAVLLARPPAPAADPPRPSHVPPLRPAPARPGPTPLRPLSRPSAVGTFVTAFLGSFSLIALLGLGAWLALGDGRAAPATETRPAVLAGHVVAAAGARTGSAADLYGRIALSMSLYDLDRAAGGLGRVIHTHDPHTLLLSYDYPGQTVRVSLYRFDVSSEDYQVQAVALYRGRQLLSHTAGE